MELTQPSPLAAKRRLLASKEKFETVSEFRDRDDTHKKP
jgi:hypothetical protein